MAYPKIGHFNTNSNSNFGLFPTINTDTGTMKKRDKQMASLRASFDPTLSTSPIGDLVQIMNINDSTNTHVNHFTEGSNSVTHASNKALHFGDRSS